MMKTKQEQLVLVFHQYRDACEKAGISVVSRHFHHYDPEGITGIYIIQESHLAVHTWPEIGLVTVDLFSCKMNREHLPFYNFLKISLQAGRLAVKTILRGK